MMDQDGATCKVRLRNASASLTSHDAVVVAAGRVAGWWELRDHVIFLNVFDQVLDSLVVASQVSPVRRAERVGRCFPIVANTRSNFPFL